MRHFNFFSNLDSISLSRPVMQTRTSKGPLFSSSLLPSSSNGQQIRTYVATNHRGQTVLSHFLEWLAETWPQPQGVYTQGHMLSLASPACEGSASFRREQHSKAQ